MLRFATRLIVLLATCSFAGCNLPKQQTVVSFRLDLGKHGVLGVDHHLDFGGQHEYGSKDRQTKGRME